MVMTRVDAGRHAVPVDESAEPEVAERDDAHELRLRRLAALLAREHERLANAETDAHAACERTKRAFELIAKERDASGFAAAQERAAAERCEGAARGEQHERDRNARPQPGDHTAVCRGVEHVPGGTPHVQADQDCHERHQSQLSLEVGVAPPVEVAGHRRARHH